jgi:PEGA domain
VDQIAPPVPPAVQPATPKPAPAPQPPPVAKSPAIVTVTGAPAGTDVSIAGASIGVAPGPVQVARGDSQVVLTFKAAGYQPASRAITPDRDQQLDVQLHKIHHATPAASNKDSILDPFGAR